MSWNRREVLGGLSVASAQAILWATGCSAPGRVVRRAPDEVSGEVRTWLRDAVSLLRGAGFTSVHALAVSRTRTTAAIDVLGRGVARSRADGVVLAVQQGKLAIREQVTSELTREGVMAAARTLAGNATPARVDFGPPAPPIPAMRLDPASISDARLLERVEALHTRDPGGSSRIVYSASVIDLDDAMMWSVAPGRDLQQRRVRVRRVVTRVAWNGTRPIVSEVARAWSGGIDDQDLHDEQLAYARDAALVLLTPSGFPDGEHGIVLAPDVAAIAVDETVRALLTTAALARPEVARRLALGAEIASAQLTLVDDPAAATAYGGFELDDEGEPAAPITLLDRGHIVGRLGDRAALAAGTARVAGRGRRPGHVGRVEPSPSHVRITPGARPLVLDQGFQLEGGLAAVVDPSSDRVVISVARALEIKGGKRTGRVYGDIELVGDLGPLLASVSELSPATETIGLRDEIDGQPRFRSIEVPWLRARGVLRARARST